MDAVARVSIYVVCATLVSAADAFARAKTDEDAEVRTPVVVKTKRNSIAPRSLPRLIELAEENSPAIKAAQADLNTARLNYEIASREWYPKLDFKTYGGFRGQSPWNNDWPKTPWASTLDLTLSENLYDNGTTITNFEIARSKFDRARIEFEIARDQQLMNIATAWYDWSYALEQREILENNRDMLRRQHNVLEVQYKQGIKTKRDVLRIETEMRRLELDVLNSDNEIDLNFQKLASFTGISREILQKEDLEGDEAKPFMKFDDRVEELKPADHRKAKVFAFLEKEAAFNTRLERRKYLPQVDIKGEGKYHNQDYLFNYDAKSWDEKRTTSWWAGITLTYNLWDWGILDRKLQIARVAEAKQVSTNAQALLDLSNDLRNVLLQLRSLRENVKMTRELLVLEQQSYAILETEYRNGRAQYLDLILNLKSLIDARSKFIASYYGLKKQQVLYQFHQGGLYDYLRQR